MKKVFLSILAIAAASSLMAGVTPHYEIEAGYDHGISHLREWYASGQQVSYFFENGHMDGFHVGGNVLMDFADGQHKPGLIIGLNYQFLANNLGNEDASFVRNREKYFETVKANGGKNATLYDYAFMHTIQVPVRFQYTYQVDNDWRVMLQTGPQVRFHVVSSENKEKSCTIDGKKNGWWSQDDCVSGNYTKKTWVNGEVEAYQFESEDILRMNWFDMSWGFGFGFGWQWLSVNVSYDLGMLNLVNKDAQKVAKDLGGKWVLNSDALAVTLGFRLK